jgi:hypothetical protein
LAVSFIARAHKDGLSSEANFYICWWISLIHAERASPILGAGSQDRSQMEEISGENKREAEFKKIESGDMRRA